MMITSVTTTKYRAAFEPSSADSRLMFFVVVSIQIQTLIQQQIQIEKYQTQILPPIQI